MGRPEAARACLGISREDSSQASMAGWALWNNNSISSISQLKLRHQAWKAGCWRAGCTGE